MEFVFEPDLVDGEEAAALVKELAFTLQLLGVYNGRMEGHLQKLLDFQKLLFVDSIILYIIFYYLLTFYFFNFILIIEGALRVDANVSVSRDDDLGVRTEIKNIGSVRAVAAAIKYEISRQISILEAGNEIFNETRAWDAIKKITIPMREKEDKEVIYYFVFMLFLKLLDPRREPKFILSLNLL